MTPLRQQAAIIIVGTASILAGIAVLLAGQPGGRGLVGAGIIGLALTLGARR